MGDDGGYALRHYNVPVGVLPDIAAVVQKVLDAVVSQGLSPCVLRALLVQIVPDFLHGRALGIPFEGFQHKGGGQRVELEILLAVDGVTDGQGAAVILGFEGVLRHAPNYLLGQIGGVIFGIPLQHALQNNALGPIGNDLGGGHHLDPVLFQCGLVPGAVVAVPGEPVQFPDNHHVKEPSAAVLHHVLELRTVVRLGGKGPVNVVPQDGNAVLLGKSGTLPDLALYAFLPLVVAGIAGIYHDLHSFTPSSISMMVFFRRSFMGDLGSKHISTNCFMSLSSSRILGLNSYSLPWGFSVRQQR